MRVLCVCFVQNALRDHASQSERHNAQLADVRRERDDALRQHGALEANLAALRDEQNTTLQQLAQLKQQHADVVEQLRAAEAAKARTYTLESDVEELRERERAVCGERDELTAQLAQAAAQHDAQLAEATAQHTARLEQVTAQLAAAKQRAEQLQEQLDYRVSLNDDSARHVHSTVAESKQRVEAAERELADRDESIAKLQQELRQLRGATTAAMQAAHHANAAAASPNNELAAVKARLFAMESDLEEYKGACAVTCVLSACWCAAMKLSCISHSCTHMCFTPSYMHRA